jgi:hypothetical protein
MNLALAITFLNWFLDATPFADGSDCPFHKKLRRFHLWACSLNSSPAFLLLYFLDIAAFLMGRKLEHSE